MTRMSTRDRVVLLTIAGVIAIATVDGCAFAAGQRAPRPFCGEPGERLVLPGELVDTATVWGRGGRVLTRLPVYTRDSVCIRHGARDWPPASNSDTLDRAPDART